MSVFYVNHCRHIMTNMGEKLTEEEANDMIACADSDAQGEIDYKGSTLKFSSFCAGAPARALIQTFALLPGI